MAKTHDHAWRYAEQRHKRAARAIFNALVADEPEVWDTIPVLCSIHLDRPEKAALAFQSMRACDEQDRHAVLAALYAGGAR